MKKYNPQSPMEAATELPVAPTEQQQKQQVSEEASREKGVPWVWVSGGALATMLLIMIGLFGYLFSQGITALWPKSIIEIPLSDGKVIEGTIHRTHIVNTDIQREDGSRYLEKTEKAIIYKGNQDFNNIDFQEINASLLANAKPTQSWYVERLEWGPFIGSFKEIKILENGTMKTIPVGTSDSNDALFKAVEDAQDRFDHINDVEADEIHPLNVEIEGLRIEAKRLKRLSLTNNNPDLQKELKEIEEKTAVLRKEYEEVSKKLMDLRALDAQQKLVIVNPAGEIKEIALSQVVRLFQPISLGITGKVQVFLSRMVEFLFAKPREANTAGGVFPAIFGTVVMTLLMSLAVLPVGVLTAVYMREIAKQGPIVSFVRIAVGNLAGVPSIVYGVFGLGFFCYTLGVRIDELFFFDKLPNPTFGTGGILWASLTLALLTVPVVIVSTEEALSAVPRTLREASYGCGATRFQTLARIVIPKATPGIMTGLVLAMARGAGEVAPLLVTGVVKLASELPLDLTYPFIHLERSFMHLGFHIYDLGFQSRSAEASRPIVFMTTLLLIVIVLVLNFSAIKVRSVLRKKFEGRGAF